MSLVASQKLSACSPELFVMPHSFFIWAQEEAHRGQTSPPKGTNRNVEDTADKHAVSYFQMIGRSVPNRKVPEHAAADAVAKRIDKETSCGTAAKNMASEAIRRTRGKGLIEIVTDDAGTNWCVVARKEEKGKEKKAKDKDNDLVAEIASDSEAITATADLLPGQGDKGKDASKEPFAGTQHAPVSALTNTTLEGLPEQEEEKLEEPPDQESAACGGATSRVASVHEHGTAGKVRFHVIGQGPLPVTEKNNALGKYWVEEKLKPRETVTKISYGIVLDRDSSPEEIRNKVMEHFPVNIQARECYDLQFRAGSKERTWIDIKNRPLKDINLEGLELCDGNPLIYIRFRLKSQKEMLKLPGTCPTKEVERVKRRSARLANPDNTSIDDLKSETLAVTKTEEAEKRAKQKARRRKRETQNGEGEARKSRRTTGAGTTKRVHQEKIGQIHMT